MKNRFLAALTALLCVTGVMTAFPATASETDVISCVPYMRGDGVCGSLQFENVSIDADLIVVSGNYVLPIYAEESHYNEDSFGTVVPEGELQVGDLLKANGTMMATERDPGGFVCHDGFTKVGNAVDLWGEEVSDVIRTQIILEQTRLDILEQTRQDKWDEEYDVNSHIQLIASGDVDVNNTIDVSDASAVLQDVAAALMDSSQLSGPQFKAADVNGDGVLTVDDASVILRYIAAKLMDDTAQLSDFT